MVFNKQGFSIDLKTNENEIFIILKATGKLTHEDYLILIPKIDAALEGLQHPEIKALLDTTDMEGWTLRALCDDCKLGLRHVKKFSRVAIYGNKALFKYAAKIGGLFISGAMKYFENYDEALEWVLAPKI
jgi:hypothetical protein